MKQETNNEMDLLLRRLGRRHDAAASAGGDHLDADELSAYAENVLPATARARYSEHLAECSRCRELVVQLSSAAGVVVAQDAVKIPQPSLLKNLLASFFSPMVLRYAVPALGLIIVGFIGLVVLRRNAQHDLVTEVLPHSPQPSAVSTTPQGEQNNYGYLDRQQKPSSTVDQLEKQQAVHNKPAEPPSPNSAPVATVTATPSPETRDQKAEQSVASANEPPPKETPNAAAGAEQKPQQAVEVQAQKEIIDSPTPTIQRSVDKVRAGEDKARTDDEREEKDLAASREVRAKRPAKSVAGLATVGGAADNSKKDGSGETRSVAGRNFRKERGIWIDTAYDSRRTITLTRGSEQYRAVVADEPEIKTIADQLDGEIIVLWKGSAYRIK